MTVMSGFIQTELSEEGEFAVNIVQNTAEEIIVVFREREYGIVDVCCMDAVGTYNKQRLIRKGKKPGDIGSSGERRRVDQNIIKFIRIPEIIENLRYIRGINPVDVIGVTFQI